MGSTQNVTRLQRMSAQEIGGGQTFAAFDLDFEQIQQAVSATDGNAARISADDGAG